MNENPTTTPASNEGPRPKKVVGKPFGTGFDPRRGNGPTKIEPRVRRYARRYDRKMCRVLAEIAADPKVPAAERRRAAMDLVAIGSGRPATTQELVGRGGEPLQPPLVQMNFGAQPGAPLTADQAYRLMLDDQLPEGADHPAFHRNRPAIDAEPAERSSTTPEVTENSAAPEASGEATEGISDKRIAVRDDLRRTVNGLVE